MTKKKTAGKAAKKPHKKKKPSKDSLAGPISPGGNLAGPIGPGGSSAGPIGPGGKGKK